MYCSHRWETGVAPDGMMDNQPPDGDFVRKETEREHRQSEEKHEWADGNLP